MEILGEDKLGLTWGGPYIVVSSNGDGFYRLKIHVGRLVCNLHDATYRNKVLFIIV